MTFVSLAECCCPEAIQLFQHQNRKHHEGLHQFYILLCVYMQRAQSRIILWQGEFLTGIILH